MKDHGLGDKDKVDTPEENAIEKVLAHEIVRPEASLYAVDLSKYGQSTPEQSTPEQSTPQPQNDSPESPSSSNLPTHLIQPPQRPQYGSHMPPPQKPQYGSHMPPPQKPQYGSHMPPPQKPQYGSHMPPPQTPQYGSHMPPPQKPSTESLYAPPMPPPQKPSTESLYAPPMPPPQKPSTESLYAAHMPSPSSGGMPSYGSNIPIQTVAIAEQRITDVTNFNPSEAEWDAAESALKDMPDGSKFDRKAHKDKTNFSFIKSGGIVYAMSKKGCLQIERGHYAIVKPGKTRNSTKLVAIKIEARKKRSESSDDYIAAQRLGLTISQAQRDAPSDNPMKFETERGQGIKDVYEKLYTIRPWLGKSLQHVFNDNLAGTKIITNKQHQLLLFKALTAVSEANHLGVVHNDLKADNLMCSIDNDNVSITLTDTEIATILPEGSESITWRGEKIKGVSGYIPPETFQEARYSSGKDAFALGVEFLFMPNLTKIEPPAVVPPGKIPLSVLKAYFEASATQFIDPIQFLTAHQIDVESIPFINTLRKLVDADPEKRLTPIQAAIELGENLVGRWDVAFSTRDGISAQLDGLKAKQALKENHKWLMDFESFFSEEYKQLKTQLDDSDARLGTHRNDELRKKAFSLMQDFTHTICISTPHDNDKALELYSIFEQMQQMPLVQSDPLLAGLCRNVQLQIMSKFIDVVKISPQERSSIAQKRINLFEGAVTDEHNPDLPKLRDPMKVIVASPELSESLGTLIKMTKKELDARTVISLVEQPLLFHIMQEKKDPVLFQACLRGGADISLCSVPVFNPEMSLSDLLVEYINLTGYFLPDKVDLIGEKEIAYYEKLSAEFKKTLEAGQSRYAMEYKNLSSDLAKMIHEPLFINNLLIGKHFVSAIASVRPKVVNMYNVKNTLRTLERNNIAAFKSIQKTQADLDAALIMAIESGATEQTVKHLLTAGAKITQAESEEQVRIAFKGEPKRLSLLTVIWKTLPSSMLSEEQIGKQLWDSIKMSNIEKFIFCCDLPNNLLNSADFIKSILDDDSSAKVLAIHSTLKSDLEQSKDDKKRGQIQKSIDILEKSGLFQEAVKAMYQQNMDQISQMLYVPRYEKPPEEATARAKVQVSMMAVANNDGYLDPPSPYSGITNGAPLKMRLNGEDVPIGYNIHLPTGEIKNVFVQVYGGLQGTSNAWKPGDLTRMDYELIQQGTAVVTLNLPDLINLKVFQLSMPESLHEELHACINHFHSILKTEPHLLHQSLADLKLDEMKTYLYGASFGGVMTVRHAEMYPGTFTGYISHDGALSLETFAKHDRASRVKAESHLDPSNPEEIRKIRDPIIIMHNRDDNNVSIQASLEFYRLLEAENKADLARLCITQVGNPIEQGKDYKLDYVNKGHYIPSSNEEYERYSKTVMDFINKGPSSMPSITQWQAYHHHKLAGKDSHKATLKERFVGEVVEAGRPSELDGRRQQFKEEIKRQKDLLSTSKETAEKTWDDHYKPLFYTLYHIDNITKDNLNLAVELARLQSANLPTDEMIVNAIKYQSYAVHQFIKEKYGVDAHNSDMLESPAGIQKFRDILTDLTKSSSTELKQFMLNALYQANPVLTQPLHEGFNKYPDVQTQLAEAKNDLIASLGHQRKLVSFAWRDTGSRLIEHVRAQKRLAEQQGPIHKPDVKPLAQEDKSTTQQEDTSKSSVDVHSRPTKK